jgi:hypothetical protein
MSASGGFCRPEAVIGQGLARNFPGRLRHALIWIRGAREHFSAVWSAIRTAEEALIASARLATKIVAPCLLPLGAPSRPRRPRLECARWIRGGYFSSPDCSPIAGEKTRRVGAEEVTRRRRRKEEAAATFLPRPQLVKARSERLQSLCKKSRSYFMERARFFVARKDPPER